MKKTFAEAMFISLINKEFAQNVAQNVQRHISA